MKAFRPLLLLTSILLLVGLACGLSGGGDTPVQPEQPQAPAQAPAQEADSPSEAPPSTEEPAPANEMYFTEEFDQDPGWNFFLTTDSDEDKYSVEFDDSLMIFDLDDTGIYAYYLYEDQEYDDVRIDIRAENRGKNNNNVSLVCRASEDGWYEFSTEGGGLWYLYAVTINEENKAVYKRIGNGGAQSLKLGKEVNEYGMVCEDREITLFINGKELTTVTEREYNFRKGYVGFNISSLNVKPIILEVDWFQVSEP